MERQWTQVQCQSRSEISLHWVRSLYTEWQLFTLSEISLHSVRSLYTECDLFKPNEISLHWVRSLYTDWDLFTLDTDSNCRTSTWWELQKWQYVLCLEGKKALTNYSTTLTNHFKLRKGRFCLQSLHYDWSITCIDTYLSMLRVATLVLYYGHKVAAMALCALNITSDRTHKTMWFIMQLLVYKHTVGTIDFWLSLVKAHQ
jgi:hypothetical protein